MFDEALLAQAAALLALCKSKGLRLATAESCTGGLIAGLLTEIPGSSAVFERGFVTYSNEAKTELLGVAKTQIETHGAVSENVAALMAEGAIARSGADIAVSITGIAGPGGGSPHKPVGTVIIAIATRQNNLHVETHYFSGNRSEIRLQSVARALTLLADCATAFALIA